MNTTMLKPLGRGLLAAALAVAGHSATAEGGDAASIIGTKCVACHITEGDKQWSRISHQRKTPEGWLMTIGRMQTMHGLDISAEETRTVVKYLADRQGLAPSETEGFRYALERRMNTHEEIEAPLGETCARCHSGARVKLQRRPEAEWKHLANFHVGQYPTIEYQALSRDRDWWPIVLNDVVPLLGKEQPLASKAWTDWQQQAPATVTGSWSLAGHMPGKGDLHGVMTVTAASGTDQYSVTVEGAFADGTPLNGSGSAVIYTGYEWRASVTFADTTMRQVFMLQDGMLSGRMFDSSDDSNGADVVAALNGSGKAHVLAVQPAYIKAGSEAELTIVGSDLSKAPSLGNGVSVVKVLESSDNLIRVVAKASAGSESVNRIGDATLAVYGKVADIRVVPEFAVARIGHTGNSDGGSTRRVPARFDAEAWSAGKDGKTGTADDFRIGVMPADWSVEPFDAQAEEDEDVKFAGEMQAASGIFLPAGAGPNPERKMMTNNAGHLKVVASVAEGDDTLNADAELIVTVQRWNNPPIP